jgi:transketolase
MEKSIDPNYCQQLARKLRIHVLNMTNRARSSHVGTSLSICDLIAVLYGEVLRVRPQEPAWADRDRFVLSKGHGASAVYAALAERGFFPASELENFYQSGSLLAGHLTHTGVPGVEASTGSLGHGLALAAGMAIAGKRDGRPYRVFTVLSDGECDEGSVWEAALFAPFHRLDNLVVMVDYNKIQSFGQVREVLDLEPFADKWKAFGWSVREIDGHDIGQVREALLAVPWEAGRPSCVIAHTVKGKGVSFMEHQLVWHYRPPSDADHKLALAELEAAE